jgi:amino-acid N-acetyltransferase
MNEVTFSQAQSKDLQPVQQLLLSCDLPYQDIAEHLPHFILARQDTQLVGVIGLEVLETAGLLRSLAVAAPQRGQGLAKSLYRQIVEQARRLNLQHLYLLTLTAEGFFAKLGFSKIERSALPPAVQQTEEFQSLCPDTAVCMVKKITNGV